MRKTFTFDKPIKSLDAAELFDKMQEFSSRTVAQVLDWFDRANDPEPYSEPISQTELLKYGHHWNLSYEVIQILRPLLQQYGNEGATELMKKDEKIQAVLTLLS